MNIETLKSLTGWKRPTVNPTPTDLEIALARIHADHTTAMVAIKLLTESVQANSTGNLNMVLAQQGRQETLVTKLNEIKRTVTASDGKHFAAFELAVRPMTRAINDLMDKVNGLNADIHTMKTEIYADHVAQARIQNTKINAIAFQLDTLVTILAKDLLKHPEGVTVAPLKEETRGGPRYGAGRKPGVKPRPLEVQYADLSNKLQRCHAPKARAKFMARLVALRAKMGMAPMSDRALGNIHARTAT